MHILLIKGSNMKGKKKEYKVADYAWEVFKNTGIVSYYMFYRKINELKW